MRVPSPITTNTKPSRETRDFFTAAGASPEAFGAGIGRAITSIGQNLIGLSTDFRALREKTDQEQEKSQRFTALQTLNDWSTETDQHMTELKRGYDPATGNFFKTASDEYEKRTGELLKQIPENLRPEFQLRANQVKQRVLSDAFDFEIAQKDTYYKTGVTKIIDEAKIALDDDASEENLKAQMVRVEEFLNSTGLSEIDKDKFAEVIKVALPSVLYKAKSRQRAIVGSDNATFATIVKHEGYRSKPYMDTKTSGGYSGLRIGFGSDTITFPDGTFRKVRAGDRITEADAQRDLERRVNTEFQPRVVMQIGEDTHAQYDANTKAALNSVAYNYGSLPRTVVEAAKSLDKEKLAQAIESLPANPGRRKQEAALVRGSASAVVDDLDDNPIYNAIPYEDRLALREDAEKEGARADAQAKAEAKAAYDQYYNAFKTGIYDGTLGQQDIADARAAGRLTDIDDIITLDNLYKQRSADMLREQEFGKMMTQPGYIFDGSKESMDTLNSGFKDARQNIESGNQQYITDKVVPVAQKLKDIPTSVSDLLGSMTRSASPQQSLYALEALRTLQDQAPDAFEKRVSPDAKARLDRYTTLSEYLPPAVVAERLGDGVDAAERAARVERRKEAAQVLGKSGKLDALPSMFDGYFSSAPSAGYFGSAQTALQHDYSTLFAENYAIMGNEDIAHAATEKQMKRIWGVTELGGRDKILMKYPPQAVGIPESRHKFMDAQIREELKLKPGESYQLIGDSRTWTEFVESQTFRNPGYPTYNIVRFDANGTPIETRDGISMVQRWGFAMTPEMKEVESREFNRRNLEYQYNRMTIERRLGKAVESQGGPAYPAELESEYKQLEEEYNREFKAPTEPTPDQLPFESVQ